MASLLNFYKVFMNLTFNQSRPVMSDGIVQGRFGFCICARPIPFNAICLSQLHKINAEINVCAAVMVLAINIMLKLTDHSKLMIVDHNNVDVDIEMASLAKNQIYYNALATEIGSYITRVKTSITNTEG